MGAKERAPLCLQPDFLCSSSCASLWDISMNLWAPTLLRYAKSPALVKTLFCPCAGSNWSTKRSHGNPSHIPQCSTRSFAQAYNLHLPQKGSPFWLPHPEQLGFSFLLRNLHVPQYVPQGGTSLLFIHSGLKYQQIYVIIISLVWHVLIKYLIKISILASDSPVVRKNSALEKCGQACTG